MNCIDSLQWRYAVKKFDDKKTLSEDKINTLKEAFNLTATSYGLQPVKLVVLQNKEIQKSLVKHSWNQPQVEQATHVLVFCIPKEYTIKEVEDYFDLVKKIRNTPDEILNPFKGFLTEDIAKKYFRMPNGEIEKSDNSPVTLADREIEAMIRRNIKEHYPNHGIIGEEYGNENEDAEFKWIIDPIDGTSSFIIGRPTFGTLIALAHNNKSILGIINQPITGERWFGIDDGSEHQGAWLNGKPITTRNCTEIQDSVISTTSPYFFDNYEWERFEKITKIAKYQKYGGVI